MCFYNMKAACVYACNVQYIVSICEILLFFGCVGQRPNYNANGYGNQQRSFGQNGTGRQQYYGDRQPRMNFNNGGAPRTYNNFDPNSASSKMDIDSKKVGMVIGRGGGKIREIQDNFNVHVKIGNFFFMNYFHLFCHWFYHRY